MRHEQFGFEAQLLQWANSSSRGPTITIQLADEDDLIPFQTMTMSKGKIAGQRMAIAVALIEDDEKITPMPEKPEPKAEKKGGGGKGYVGLSGLAARWCADEEFRAWLAADMGLATMSEAGARQMMLTVCGIKSRAELNDNKEAAALFDEHFRAPYQAHLDAQ